MAVEVLLVEATGVIAALWRKAALPHQYHLVVVTTGAEALRVNALLQANVILLDLQLANAMEILRALQRQQLNAAIMLFSRESIEPNKMDMLRLGVAEYITPPYDGRHLRAAVQRLSRLGSTDESSTIDVLAGRFHGFIGSSKIMQNVYRVVESASESKATVFITGESGTGKEVCALAIHRQSGRNKQGEFVAINCGAIPKDLMESELFGHVKGAFTGAIHHRQGAVEQADGGTLFLDEVCEMSLDLQVKLLRFLQTGNFHRVGSGDLQEVDVRIVCASNRTPLEQVQAGMFRKDLYYRLHVIPLHLPPLRERGDDIAMLSEYFLVKYAREEGKDFSIISSDAMQLLSAYGWPGNVRELQNWIRQMVVLNVSGQVTAGMLPAQVRSGSSVLRGEATVTAVDDEDDSLRPLWLMEKDYIERAVAQCDGNIPKAAAMLEVSASTIYRKKQAWASRELPC
ncbi:DNA-binding NtrC family response regulator [Sinobacterium caligoides]|uniref:DNA-binding NtrC family response regulator n=1 Tax=Sinobacterium caligoides TaxID=933926 RepID=A0A3N2DNW4_9GAMM|nr:sigma-54 dependent transcriptional regulator [Sinobacterium caligoides]ROS01503.1 DNA-binding NtrC family response regulator [Sinobacterium caligoides]